MSGAGHVRQSRRSRRWPTQADVVLMPPVPVLMPRLATRWGTNGFPASEDLDDAHRGTAVRADERGRHDGDRRCGRRRRFDRGGNDVQQFARLGEMLAAPGIGQQAVVGMRWKPLAAGRATGSDA